MQGNCSDPDPVAALGLAAGAAPSLLPLKKQQCLLVVPDAFMMINNGTFWVDNVYLLLRRSTSQPGAAFLSAGAARGLDPDPRVGPARLYVTNVTFHAEHRGSARGVTLERSGSSALVQGAHPSIMARCPGPQ